MLSPGRGIDSGRGFGSSQLDQFQGHKHSKQIGTQVDSSAEGDGAQATWISNRDLDRTFDASDNLDFTINQVTVVNVYLLVRKHILWCVEICNLLVWPHTVF